MPEGQGKARVVVSAEPAPSSVDVLAAGDVSAIVSGAAAAAYEWTTADDRIRWDAGAASVLGVPLERIAPGRTASRHDTVLNSPENDTGNGVPFEVQYTLLPGGVAGSNRIILEDSGRWYAGDNGRPARVCGIVRVINARAEREERRAFLSRYDELTGFFNRPYLITALGEALAKARRLRTNIAFLIVAVDNFRAINEAYDFDTADQVFAAVGRRIKNELREGDAIGRYSGNKLGIVLMDCSESDMHAAAERFHAAVRQDIITTEASSVAATVSIGGVGLPRHGRTVPEALARAQEGLHQARKLGHGQFVAYTPSPTRETRQRENAALSSELVAALNQRRLRLSFQPIVQTRSREPVFYEGLLRLERLDGTVVLADEFVGLAERLGLLRMIDNYVLGRTLETLEAAPEARVSVNVSAETVGDGEWLSLVAAAVRRRPDLAGRLIVEITETAMIRSLDEAAQFVATLHDLGCPVAIDDFGSGFSSFRSLRMLKADMVKIAGVFLKNLPEDSDDQAFVKALVTLGRQFEMQIVAEWVEDEPSAKVLAELGVDMIQGLLVGPATPDWPWAPRRYTTTSLRDAG